MSQVLFFRHIGVGLQPFLFAYAVIIIKTSFQNKFCFPCSTETVPKIKVCNWALNVYRYAPKCNADILLWPAQKVSLLVTLTCFARAYKKEGWEKIFILWIIVTLVLKIQNRFTKSHNWWSKSVPFPREFLQNFTSIGPLIDGTTSFLTCRKDWIVLHNHLTPLSRCTASHGDGLFRACKCKQVKSWFSVHCLL